MAAQRPAGPPPTMMTSVFSLRVIPSPGEHSPRTSRTLKYRTSGGSRVSSPQVQQIHRSMTAGHRTDQHIHRGSRPTRRGDQLVTRENRGNVEHAHPKHPVLADE